MTVYVRADVSCVSEPAVSGGCGKPHVRPVADGVPVHRTPEGKNAPWPLTCPQCEPFLKQDIVRSGGKKIRTMNPDHGLEMAPRFLGLFGATKDTIPETPDEEKARQANELKTATEQAAAIAENAHQQTVSIGTIAQAIAGNTELMAKFMELQIGKQAPAPVVLAEPVPVAAVTCQDCGSEFERKSNKGPAPRRCPDCKAKAAA